MLGTNPLELPTLVGRAQLGAMWHRDLFCAVHRFRDLNASIVVSRSRDGDLICAVLDALGYAPAVRGSSSRGGTRSLRAMMRLCEAGTTIGILVDGPRGPAGVVKPGIVALARLTGIPITPVVFACRPALRFRSWDGTRLPPPFARVRCAFGEPIPVASDADDALCETLRRRLEASMHALAETLAAGPAAASRP